MVNSDKGRKESSLVSRIIETAGSVRFGIVLLILIVVTSFLGMVIRQHNVPGFDSYFAELGPFQRALFSVLGFFDIYHTWYFYALLAFLSLNILCASIERFPKTLRFITNRNHAPSSEWVKGRDIHAAFDLNETRGAAGERISRSCRSAGFRKFTVTENEGRTIFYAEKGAWNRLGAYPVHVALLTILLGGLLSSLFGFTGEMSLSRGQTTDEIISTVYRDGRPGLIKRKLPFSVHCTDLEQRLKDPRGSIEISNSLDWVTRLEISDGSGKTEAVVRLNRPFDFRGYRFFHSTYLPIGKARSVLIQVVQQGGNARDISLRQNGSATLSDGTRLRFIDFRANLNPDERTGDENSTSFQNPAAIIEVTSPDGSKRTAYVFRKNRKSAESSLNAFEGLDMRLMDFERVSETHILFVQHDPGTAVLYTGFFLLVLSLAAVFFFSHKRIWIVVEETSDDALRITLGGDTNREHLSFERKFWDLVDSVKIQGGSAKASGER